MAATSSAESKTQNITFVEEDNSYYIGDLKITGVAWLIRDGANKSSICLENRVALTKAEQEEIGDSQPFMLNNITYDINGSTLFDETLAKAYFDKMLSKDKNILFKNPNTQPWIENETNSIEQIIIDAKERAIRFKERHFPMAVLREGIKKGEHPSTALIRGVKEECKKKFKEGIQLPRHKFVYERRKNTCLLVYFVENNNLEIDIEATKCAGKCNYFCAKSLKCINNDFLETKNHEILENGEIERRLHAFEKKFGEQGIGCDLKYWGGLKMWNECKKYL